MTNVVVFDNGIKKIAVNDLDGELITELRINIADGSTLTRFQNVIERLNVLGEEVDIKQTALIEKFKDAKDEDITINDLNEVNAVKKEYIDAVIKEIDYVFGKDTVRNVFKQGYELNEDYYPDEDALIDLVSNLIPVMEDLYKERFKALKKQYSANRRGKKK